MIEIFQVLFVSLFIKFPNCYRFVPLAFVVEDIASCNIVRVERCVVRTTYGT